MSTFKSKLVISGTSAARLQSVSCRRKVSGSAKNITTTLASNHTSVPVCKTTVGPRLAEEPHPPTSKCSASACVQ